MRNHILWQLLGLTVWGLLAAYVVEAAVDLQHSDVQPLPGNRVLLGTVEEVRGEQARIDTGEGTPRYVPMGVRTTKKLPAVKTGDWVEITVNEQNLLVDVHLLGESSYHHVVEGRLIQPLVTGHHWAVLRTTEGKEESYFIRPVARSKVASIPVGVDAAFLIDEMNRIVDVTFVGMEAARHAAELWQKKTPLKNAFDRIPGVILTTSQKDGVAIRSEEGVEQSYQVRSFARMRLEKISTGDAVVLLVDDEGKVMDVAIPPRSSGRQQQ